MEQQNLLLMLNTFGNNTTNSGNILYDTFHFIY